MKQRVIVAGVIIFAFAVLLISVFRSAQIKYSVRLVHSDQAAIINSQINQEYENIFIDYYLPYPGPILPGSFWWTLKSARDQVWVALTFDTTAKAELNLLLADKRLVAAKLLFDQGNNQLGITTLSKAEKYLEKAVDLETKLEDQGVNTLDLTTTLIKASIKHRQVIKQIMLMAPDDAKATLTLIENYPRGIYGRKIKVLQQHGVPLIVDPFNGL